MLSYPRVADTYDLAPTSFPCTRHESGLAGGIDEKHGHKNCGCTLAFNPNVVFLACFELDALGLGPRPAVT